MMPTLHCKPMLHNIAKAKNRLPHFPPKSPKTGVWGHLWLPCCRWLPTLHNVALKDNVA